MINLALVKLLAAVALVAAAVGAVSWWNHHEREIGRAEVQAKWDSERAALQAQVAEQRQRNVDLQRASELRYTVQADTRERVITKIITEVRDATASLAACPVGADAVRLLNDAGRCSGSDSTAACGVGDAVQPPG